ncbi:hypothetical protein Skr01_75930 [Sphaerisporangium krabiense]|uniref:Uncharacterized protein n=1 Tax=Sphaerisporangium krabiense TaxID=763782 RepID=A0A7W8Z957_9ACTN|nr:hypothetical protein [Sphaerisporangium krabiense]MBB5629338.1 hypothetical protein [Sphaerisporangium krabiense]GII67508.1 hypothetical protein Skr01_75930 [Sphaerisporangium krabiense]
MDIDLQYRLRDARRRPTSYGMRTFDEAAAFLIGADMATDWTLLHGFQEWVAELWGSQRNLAWPLIAARLLDARRAGSGQAGDAEWSEEDRIRALFDLVEEFFVESSKDP